MSKADLREVDRKIAAGLIGVSESDDAVIVTVKGNLKPMGRQTIKSAYAGKVVSFIEPGVTLVPNNPEWETKTLKPEAEERRTDAADDPTT